MDLEALARRFLNPARPRLAEAREAVAGCYHPREAWEVLASREIIPEAWLEAPDRGFRADVTRIVAGSVHSETMETSFPSPMEFGVLLAADVAGVSRAEALSHEVRRRLAVWSGTTPERTVWRQIDPARDERPHHSGAQLERYSPPGAFYAAWRALEGSNGRGVTDADAMAAATIFARNREPTHALWQAAWIAGASVLWRKAAAQQKRPDPALAPMFLDVPRRRFDEMDDPFEPALALIETGYWIIGPEWAPALEGDSYGAWVLAAP